MIRTGILKFMSFAASLCCGYVGVCPIGRISPIP